MIQGFQRLGQTGDGSAKDVAALFLDVSRPLRLGNIAFVVAMAAAAALQALATTTDVGGQSESHSKRVDVGRARWARWVLVASSLLIVPAALLSRLTEGITRLGMAAATTDAAQLAQTCIAGMSIGQISATISNRLILAMTGELLLNTLLVLFAVANVFALRFTGSASSLRRYSLGLLVVDALGVAWNLIGLRGDIRWFEAALH